MANKLLKTFNELPPVARGIIAVTAVAVVVIGVRKIIKAIDERKRAEEERESVSAHEEEIKELGQKGIKPSLSDAQLQTMVAQLYKAMDGCGTDESTIMSVLRKVNNDADVKTLISKFGTKRISCWAGGSDNFSLPSALRSELSEGYIHSINNHYALKGIKTRF